MFYTSLRRMQTIGAWWSHLFISTLQSHNYHYAALSEGIKLKNDC